jgi:dimeric dUTPase (all-alpha-NTP-PPase superfamily)
MNKKIWSSQFEFNEEFFRDQKLDIHNLSLQDKIHWAKEFCFHVNKELADLINCLPHWKMHYKVSEKEDTIVTSNLIEEYIDVLKYFMGLGQLLGISYEDLIKGYNDKTEVVKQKYEQNKKFQSLLHKKVVIFDIDGVINNFPDCFLDWVNKKGKRFKSVEQMKELLDLKTYQELKVEYRLSGEKRHQPVNKETLKLLNLLKLQGETIILFTNRPVSKFKVIYTDTLYWLRKNNIPFDAIYWSDFQRKEDIYKLRFKIKYIVEDNLDNAKNFNHEGHLVFLLEKSYNQDGLYANDKLIRIKKPMELLEHVQSKGRNRLKKD